MTKSTLNDCIVCSFQSCILASILTYSTSFQSDFFSALTVRFLTRRFIGDYDPTLGEYNYTLLVSLPSSNQNDPEEVQLEAKEQWKTK